MLDVVKRLDFADRQGAFGCYCKTNIARFHRCWSDQLESVRGDDLVVGPKVIHRQILPPQVQIKKALAAVLLAIEGNQHFDLILELPLERVPPWPAGPKLNTKGGTSLCPAQIHRDFRFLSFVPEQTKTRSGATRIRRSGDAIGELVLVRIA